MIARYGIPGESAHDWIWTSSRKEARAWCEAKAQRHIDEGRQGQVRTAVLADRLARTMRYQDGNLVYRCACGSGRYTGDCHQLAQWY